MKFELRACRRTYAQRAIDDGVGLDSVSNLMGHKYTRRPQRGFTGAKGRRMQLGKLRISGSRCRVTQVRIGIDSKFEVTGYA